MKSVCICKTSCGVPQVAKLGAGEQGPRAGARERKSEQLVYVIQRRRRRQQGCTERRHRRRQWWATSVLITSVLSKAVSVLLPLFMMYTIEGLFYALGSQTYENMPGNFLTYRRLDLASRRVLLYTIEGLFHATGMQTIDTCQAMFLPIGASISLLIMFLFFDSLQMVFAVCTASRSTFDVIK